MHTRSSKKSGLILSAAIGIAISMLVTGMFLAGLTTLLIRERAGEGSTGILLYLAIIVAVFTGAELAPNIYSGNGIQIPPVVATAYFGIIAIGGTMMEGRFGNIWLHIAAICAGCGISCALCIRKTKNSRKRKKGIW